MIVNLLPSSSDEECEITNESKDSSVSFEIVSLEADAIKESSSVQSCFASQPSASQELKFGEPNDEKKFRLTGIDDLDLELHEIFETFDSKIDLQDKMASLWFYLPSFDFSDRRIPLQVTFEVADRPIFVYRFLSEETSENSETSEFHFSEAENFLNSAPGSSIIDSIEMLYVWHYKRDSPSTSLHTRDFYYKAYDKRHWSKMQKKVQNGNEVNSRPSNFRLAK